MSHSASDIDSIIGAAIAPPAAPSALAVNKSSSSPAMVSFLKGVAESSKPRDSKDAGITLGIGVAGAYLFRKSHPVLGGLGSAALAHFGPGLLNQDDRKTAGRGLLVTGGAIAGSKLLKHHPIWGFVLGLAGGGVAAYYGIK